MGLNWKAKKKGNKFCAPACGRGCTHKEYLAAVAKAKTAKKLLKNPRGWKIRVWENLGWHSSLQKGGMTLHINEFVKGKVEYSVLFTSDERGFGGGESFWTTSGEKAHNPDPNVVIEHQLKVANQFIKQCAQAVERVVA